MNSGEVFKMLLEEKGIKQNFLAKRLNIPVSTLFNKLEKELKIEFVDELCEVLNIPLLEFCKIYKEKQKKEDTANPTTNHSVFPQKTKSES